MDLLGPLSSQQQVLIAAPQAPKQGCICGGRTAKQLSRQWVESSPEVFLPLSFQDFIGLFFLAQRYIKKMK